jgi:hypothetical protein
MPASNVEIKSVVLSDLVCQTIDPDGIDVIWDISGTMNISVRDSGLLPTAGSVTIDNIYVKLDDYPLGQSDVITDTEIPLGITPLTGSVSREKDFKISHRFKEVSSPNETSETERDVIETFAYTSIYLCEDESIPLYANYTVNGLFGSASYEDQEIETKLSGPATGSRCDVVNS